MYNIRLIDGSEFSSQEVVDINEWATLGICDLDGVLVPFHSLLYIEEVPDEDEDEEIEDVGVVLCSD